MSRKPKPSPATAPPKQACLFCEPEHRPAGYEVGDVVPCRHCGTQLGVAKVYKARGKYGETTKTRFIKL